LQSRSILNGYVYLTLHYLVSNLDAQFLYYADTQERALFQQRNV